MEIDNNALGQVLDTTWGRSSTPMTASMSVKLRISSSSTITCVFQTIVNVGSERDSIIVRRQCEEQAADVVRQVINNIKKDYRELAEKTISLSEVGDPETSMEFIGNPMNQKRMTLFKRISTIEYS